MNRLALMLKIFLWRIFAENYRNLALLDEASSLKSYLTPIKRPLRCAITFFFLRDLGPFNRDVSLKNVVFLKSFTTLFRGRMDA